VTENPEARALVAAQQGDTAAFTSIVERYTPLLWSVTRALRLTEADANDAIQTTWLRLVEYLDRVRSDEALAGWLLTTCRREALRIARLGARERPQPAEDFPEVAEPPEARPEGAFLDDHRQRALHRAFVQLPAHCQQLLRLLLAAPPPGYADISAALNVPIGSLGPTRIRCLRRLRKLLDTLTEEAVPAPGDTPSGVPPTSSGSTALRAATDETVLAWMRQAGTATVPDAVVEEARRNITRPPGGTTTAALISDSAVTPHGLSGPPSGAARLLQFQTGTHEIYLEVRDTAATRTLRVRIHPPDATRAVLLRDTTTHELTPDGTTFTAHDLTPGVVSLRLHTPGDTVITTDWVAI